ncbi:putative diphthine methyl ester synthase [Tanacetum coccineum]|uniref:ATP-dependent DNA helicase n=1 Tax=Tanacetum coccineum TaxID=301880 RepID=A0ABQ4Z474_9ASTR
MDTKLTKVSELTPFRDDWKVKVRVIRLWKPPDFSNPLVTYSLDMVLMDEEDFESLSKEVPASTVAYGKIQALNPLRGTRIEPILMRIRSVVAILGTETTDHRIAPLVNYKRISVRDEFLTHLEKICEEADVIEELELKVPTIQATVSSSLTPSLGFISPPSRLTYQDSSASATGATNSLIESLKDTWTIPIKRKLRDTTVNFKTYRSNVTNHSFPTSSSMTKDANDKTCGSSKSNNLRSNKVLLSDIPILDFDVPGDDDCEIGPRNPYVGVSEEIMDQITKIKTELALSGSSTRNNNGDSIDPQITKALRITLDENNELWPEISRFMRKRGLKPEDRPEVLCKMFKFKLDHLIKNLKGNQIFGRVQAFVYTIEFQKRGLPHSHICLFLHKNDKLVNPERIDDFISAEIPDKDLDPDLYTLFTVTHEAWSVWQWTTRAFPCTIKGVCTKKFPNKYSNRTSNDSNGYPVYRRREDGNFVEKNHVRLDNRFVVPYNSYLLKKYQAHINVEWCNQAGSIKYLFKYINKGPDRVTASIQVGDHGNEAPSNVEVVDEIKEFYDCRYLSACESSWRILKYEVVYRTPAVERLPFHLPGQQHVVYDEDADIDDVLSKPSVAIWQERKHGYAIGRIQNVPKSVGDAYYLRVLLNHVKGLTSWEKIYEYPDDIIHPSFRDACFARGLLDDDREYILGLQEIYAWEFGNKVRRSFVHLLMSNSMSRPDHVFNETWKFMKDDIEYHLEMREHHIKNLILKDIDAILRSNGSSLQNISSMPLPDLEFLQNYTNTFIHDELCYNRDELKMEHANLFASLTQEQQSVYGKVISAVEKNEAKELNVASSGIDSLLLPGGRTAHSRFGILINIDETSFCSITHGTDLAALLNKTKLIIWDEAPMMNKHCFEALDRTLRDILRGSNTNSLNIPFGGKVIVFGGDFRQILPVVITGGTRQDIVHASLNSSYL